MQALLDAGADPTTHNEWLYRPLHFAAMRQEPHCCAALLAHPSQAGVLNARDKEFHTPLALAVYYKREPQARSGLHPRLAGAAAAGAGAGRPSP